MRHFYILLLTLFVSSLGFGQTTIALQDFESTPATPELTYSASSSVTLTNNTVGNTPADPKHVSGVRGLEKSNGTVNITFTTVDVSSYTDINLSFRLASFSGTSGNGADGADEVEVYISTDGGSNYSKEIEIEGNNNARWSFSSGTGIVNETYDGNNSAGIYTPVGGGNRTTDGYSIINLNGLPNSSQLSVRIRLSNNSSNEDWVIDDVLLKGTLGSSGPTPTITLSETALSGFNYVESNGPSTAQSFDVSGTDLDNTDVIITAPTDFEVSDAENGTYGSSITLSAFDGTTDELWVRLADGKTIGNYSGDITTSGGGDTTPPTLSLSGEVTAAPPTNDACSNAIALTVNNSCSSSSYSNASGTNSGTLPDPGCSIYSGADVWFSIEVPTSGNLDIETTADGITDGAMALYSGTCGALTLIECDDDDGAGFMPLISATGLVPESTVYVLFWAYDGAEEGSFNICAVDPQNPPSITNVSNDPSAPTSTDDVLISATITDSDGIGDVTLNWGINSGNLTNSLTMSDTGGGEYAVFIPAQVDGTTVYYEISATDSGASPLTSTTNEISYAVSDPIPAPSLIITEIIDPNDNANARFIEIYNNGLTEIDFSTTPIYISRFVNGALTATSGNTEELNSGTLAAGEYLVIAASGVNFTSAYGFSPDEINGGFAVNGDDPFGMYAGTYPNGTLFDVYGEIGVDGTGEDWEYENSRAIRNSITDSPSTTWQSSKWTITSANVSDATPRAGETTTYIFNGNWSPETPIGNATLNDFIVVASGNVVIDTDITCSSFTVNASAGVTIDSGVTVTVNDVTDGFTLESTSSSFASLILDGSISGTVNYKRYANSYTNNSTFDDNDLIAPPLAVTQFSDFATANSGSLLASGSLRAFAPFDKGTGTYVNYNNTDMTPLNPGTGYRVATIPTSDQILTFTGTPVSSDLTGASGINIEDNGPQFADWNLIGNPYPSYLDLEAFLTHEVSTATSGERNIDLLEGLSGVYGYDGNSNDGWTVITLANDAGELLAPGQGFFVAADGNDVGTHNIEFTTDMRRTGTADDFITFNNSNSLTYLELKAYTANNAYHTEFYFNPNASLGLDPGYDAMVFGGNAPSTFALYSHLVQDNTGSPFALQALGSNDVSNVTIPLGINANAGEQLTFTIHEMQIPDTVNVYLEDTVENTITLLNTSDYIVTPSSQLTGTGRFYITFTNTTLSTLEETLDIVDIYANNTNRTVVVSGELDANTSATLFDLQGRVVETATLDASKLTNTINVNHLRTGVYIVQLTNASGNKTAKIILK
ncbi:MAG: hypothetical protein Wins2KO_26940 [Winogradskyella sp.]